MSQLIDSFMNCSLPRLFLYLTCHNQTMWYFLSDYLANCNVNAGGRKWASWPRCRFVQSSAFDVIAEMRIESKFYARSETEPHVIHVTVPRRLTVDSTPKSKWWKWIFGVKHFARLVPLLSALTTSVCFRFGFARAGGFESNVEIWLKCWILESKHGKFVCVKSCKRSLFEFILLILMWF